MPLAVKRMLEREKREKERGEKIDDGPDWVAIMVDCCSHGLCTAQTFKFMPISQIVAFLDWLDGRRRDERDLISQLSSQQFGCFNVAVVNPSG